MFQHHSVGDSGELAALLERRILDEDQALSQVRLAFGESALNEVFDGMVYRHTISLVECQTDEERRMVQALVAATIGLRQALTGRLAAQEETRKLKEDEKRRI